MNSLVARRLVARPVLAVCLAVAACAPTVPTPSVMTSPDLTPVPATAAAEAIAERLANEWVAALRTHDFQAAWGLLAEPPQEAFGSFEQFASDEREILKTANEYIVGPRLDPDPAALANWLPSAEGASASNAFVVHVEYPVLAPFNNGDQVLVIAPDATGAWRIWPVR